MITLRTVPMIIDV